VDRKVALFWDKHPKGVKCSLCPKYCIIPEGEYGGCRKRHNIGGTLFAENYAQSIAINLDPMEKKPLYHFHPFSQILSLGPNSCNLHCQFCQNYTISLQDAHTIYMPPYDLLELCKKYGHRHVAFTYSEPFTWYEYIYDSAVLLRENGISVVLVTNGFVNPEPLAMLIPYISAMNIDLKAFTGEFYTQYCKGQLQPVLDTIEYCADKVHIELTLLLIETLNNDLADLCKMFQFIQDINANIPLHISKYFPRYKLTLGETSEMRIRITARKAREFLRYVYVGNFYNAEFLNTLCHQCGAVIIDRDTREINIKDGLCENCHAKVPVVTNN